MKLGDCGVIPEEVSLCASRFISKVDEKWRASCRNLTRFLANNEHWLSAEFSYPIGVIGVPQSSIHVSSNFETLNVVLGDNGSSSQFDSVGGVVTFDWNSPAGGAGVPQSLIPISNHFETENMVLGNDNGCGSQLNSMVGVPRSEYLGPLRTEGTKAQKRVGCPVKDFAECSERSKLRKTEHLRIHTPRAELYFATVKALHSDGFHEAARAVEQILNNPESVVPQASKKEEPCSAEEALNLQIDAGLSVRKYQSLRNVALSKGSSLFPPYLTVAAAKSECYPDGLSFSDLTAEVKLQQLVDHTSKRIACLIPPNLLADIQSSSSEWELYSKYGMDGSSNHSIYKQGFSEDEGEVGCDGNIFLCSFVPLRLVDRATKLVLWSNPAPSSTRFCRPIKFDYCKESTEVIRNTDAYLQDQVKTIIPTSFPLSDGNTVQIHHDLKFTMVDGKVCNNLIGTGSLTCYICKATPTLVNKIDDMLARPINQEALKFFISPLHAKMRSFEALLHLAYKNDVEEWAPKDQNLKVIVLARKGVIQKRFQEEMHILVDVPRSGGAGNSNDGNTARRFFQNWSKSAEILEINEELVRRLAVINQVISSGQEIDIQAYHDYAVATARLWVEKYSWYPMPPTVHKILIHGSTLIEEAILPIGQYSEEAQEASNKLYRLNRRDFARKSSRTSTNEDVFKRMLVSSDPVISTVTRRVQRPRGPDVHPDVQKLLKRNNQVGLDLLIHDENDDSQSD